MKVRTLLLLTTAAMMAAACSQTKQMDKEELLSQMSIEDKAHLAIGTGMAGLGNTNSPTIGATKKLARELGQFGIRVNAVAPGVTDTGMISGMEDKMREQILEKTVMNRVARPEEIANVVAFLASDKAGYITGQVIRVDGGIL